jgi:hypothetical protein
VVKDRAVRILGNLEENDVTVYVGSRSLEAGPTDSRRSVNEKSTVGDHCGERRKN